MYRGNVHFLQEVVKILKRNLKFFTKLVSLESSQRSNVLIVNDTLHEYSTHVHTARGAAVNACVILPEVQRKVGQCQIHDRIQISSRYQTSDVPSCIERH